ncbi:MT-A70 family methyltransferase [Ferruginivarius sediminum]|uniref:DNA methyltransferase n=1 Tax=Ferruginivarius sediminum TaxID=2661937 RepID=A0A369T7N6_9PROT|nr:MT-A70 family methyltransferase [Ferruginivarius sediminum]RDD60474.1 DNA methyltransferase [Ferruginivarius sediminum]
MTVPGSRGAQATDTDEPGSLPDGHAFAGLPRSGYRVILADPPWRFATWSHRGQGRGAEQHYPTMSTEEICALPVADAAARDCVLWLWGTWPNLPDALSVISAWGFTYKSCGFVWVKQNAKAAGLWVDFRDLFLGLGYGTRGNTEFCLRAARGAPKLKPGARAVPQLILAPRREHSRKPDETHERIEALYDGPYLEMFARERRPGWTPWGNEVDRFGGAVEATG